jgi:predicted small lipoprotein YifL
MRTITLVLGGALLLSACGSKGPLYLPPPPPAQPAAASAPDNSTAAGATR